MDSHDCKYPRNFKEPKTRLSVALSTVLLVIVSRFHKWSRKETPKDAGQT